MSLTNIRKIELKNKKTLPKTFRDAVINEGVSKYSDSPVLRKKVDDAKKFLAHFNGEI